jgi:hypothetical protein
MTEGQRFIRELEKKRVAKVRYGRAVLRIARWGDLHDSSLGQAIKDFKTGEISRVDLCWEFVRAQIESHSPSFDWDHAELDRLLPLVAHASTEPEFPSTDPDQVAKLLVETQAEQAEQMRETRERLRRQINQFAGLTSNSILGQVSKIQGMTQNLGVIQDLTGRSKALGAIQDLTGHSKAYSVALDLTSSLRDRINIADFPGLGQLQERLRGVSQDWMRDLGLGSKLRGEVLSGYIRPAWTDQLPDLNRWFKSFDFGAVIEQFRRALPANWRELESEELEEVVKLMSDEGLSLAWAPRIEIVREILAAENHEERCQILCQRDAEIIADIEATLELVTRDDLVPIKEQWSEAIGPYRDGWYSGAQSYAATLIGEIAHGPLDWKNFKPLRKSFRGRDPMKEGLHDLALCAVGKAWVRVVDDFESAGEGFNRNLTQHRIGFHNQANCLSAMLLLAGLLVEIQRFLNADDRRREDDEMEEAA